MKINNKIYIFLAIFFFSLSAFKDVSADISTALKGRILLQTESYGESWYVWPKDQKKYYLGRPNDAYLLMRKLGIGISNSDLKKIPVAVIKNSALDDDKDGLGNDLEISLGTNPQKSDTDKDGFFDYEEVTKNYDPSGSGRLNIDPIFTKLHSGKIFLQVESKGEAWYLSPTDQKRYYLGRPADAFTVMKRFGLGIKNSDLYLIPIGNLVAPVIPSTPPVASSTETDLIMSKTAEAIRQNDPDEAAQYFIPELRKSITYAIKYYSTRSEGRLTFGNILSAATLTNSSSNQKTYSTEVYFSLGGYKSKINFVLDKQTDGKWLISKI